MQRATHILFVLFFSLSSTVSCARADVFENLIPLHRVKTDPGPYDWMATHPEPGQSFAGFMASGPRKPKPGEKIYMVRIGVFDDAREEVIERTAEFIEAYYGLPVAFLDDIPTENIPESARRIHPQTQDRQILTSHIIEKILIPVKPADAYSLIAFTAFDLWPGAGWNFVFGQASIQDRVGVWSIYRNGNPNKEEEKKLCLLRTVKTGTHELGHMFGMHHCIYYECAMNGSNHRKESDERPLALCPVCLKKFISLTGQDASSRFKRLIDLSRQNGFNEEKEFYKKSLQLIK